jgi:Short-chain alcohol dehydrogenase of unknown specificity
VAVVTGAAGGLGLALTKRFHAAGMTVAMADVDAEALGAAAGELGDRAYAVPTDVTDPESVARLRRAVEDELGPAYLLCNNAGVSGGTDPTWNLPLSVWQWIIEVNLMGVVHGIREFVPGMVERDRGHVVNTASVAGLISAFGGPYTTTKHAVVGLTDELRQELASIGSQVRVSALCPGFLRTRIAEAVRNWPTRLGPLPEQDERVTRFAQESVAGGGDPAEAAEEVYRAVIERRFWITPNADGILPLIAERTRSLLEGGEPPMLRLRTD